MPNNFFDDLVDDFLGGKAAPSQPVQTARQAPSQHLPEASYTPETRELYRVRCEKCSGTGTWKGGYARYPRKCFGCEGRGFHERKTNPQVLQAAAARRVEKKVATATDNLEAFKSAQPEVFAWIEQTKASFEFAASMHKAIVDFGDLTERQLAACVKCVASHNARKAAATARVQQAPVIETDRLMACFDKALATGLKAPKLRFELFTATPAKAHSVNAGGVYLKDGETYLGKIINGRFYASRDASPDQCKAIVETMADPKAAAVAYGKRTGSCCCCGRELTDPVSIAAGIGPICASYLE